MPTDDDQHASTDATQPPLNSDDDGSTAPSVLHPMFTNARLSLPFVYRLIFANMTAFGIGGSMGAYMGAQRAALQFRAENAHRQPNSAKGWYFYHKSKNYRSMYGGVVQGVKFGGPLCAWVTMFVVFEDAVDRLRGRIDALATVAAGLTVAGVFSAWNRLSYGLAVRTAKKGFVVGLGFGLAQDFLRWGKGQSGGVGGLFGLGRRAREETA